MNESKIKFKSFKELSAYSFNKDIGYIKLKGIKCDNPDCSYRDDDVEMSQYDDYLNKSCPCCGENLFTQECYNQSLYQMNILISAYNQFCSTLDKRNISKIASEPIIKEIYPIDKNGFILFEEKMKDAVDEKEL